MAGPRDPRNFLYDDYYEADGDVDDRTDDYEQPAPRARARVAGGRSTGGTRPLRRYDDDEMDHDYDRQERRRDVGGGRSGGLVARRGSGAYESEIAGYGGREAGGGHQARRFANAMGIPPSRLTYEDEDVYGVPSRSRGGGQRALYRDAPIVRVAPQRRQRRFDDYDDDLDVGRPRGRVVEVVERIQHVPERRVIVKKVPIRQRVVKKIIVKKVRPSFAPDRRRSNENRNGEGGGGRIPRVQKGGIQKKKVGGGGGTGTGPSGSGGGGGAKGGRFQNQKPKMSAAELDRELEEYMRGSKHPRIATT